MATQIEQARRDIITAAMRVAAEAEGVAPEIVRAAVARGHAVLPANPAHRTLVPQVVGRAFRTKVNANLGYSPESSCIEEELLKLDTAVRAGADFVMDLSVGTADATAVRDAFLNRSALPLGTVPVYEACAIAGGDAVSLSPDLLLDVIEKQAAQGVDFMTLHAGLLSRHIEPALRRVMGIVSRGGALMATWMSRHGQENPLYTRWDAVLDICARHDVTVSLGDGLRPGCLADASDEAQFAELDVLGELVQRCRQRGVQVMVEGPGHRPFNQIAMNMEREQRVCDAAPFYVLGPVVTDIAPGYDHITSCIGATAAAYHGASLLCYVTPAEHLALPTLDEVKTGIIAYRIAAHAADVARGLAGARQRDDEMARARRDFDWPRQFELALDGDTARERYQRARPHGAADHCTMCGRDFCAVRNSKRLREERDADRQRDDANPGNSTPA